jgi:hypothetical protein
MEAWAKSAREDMDPEAVPTYRAKKSSCSNTTVAGWGPRSQRQTKSVWHSARDGPIARILLSGEKVPWPIGGLFRRSEKTGEERGGKAGCHKKQSIALVSTKNVIPPRRAFFKNY